jgi:hypothetical protein
MPEAVRPKYFEPDRGPHLNLDFTTGTDSVIIIVDIATVSSI